ncbi:MAG: phage tail protein [Acidobacteriota bacterium]|nr:phage tail protein [Acidobacteriota bacterium]
MANPYLAEIRLFAGTFAPKGWALCNGQILSISQNTALFSLLGTTYGGNGISTFALPNLQGMAPMAQGQGPGLTLRVLGEVSGEAQVTLLSSEVPAHTHTYNCASGSKGDSSTVAGQFNADEPAGGTPIYATTSDGTTMNPSMVQPTAASLPHENRQPYQCLNFIIALQGVFPSRS